MANPEALEARKWLNATYGNNPDFDKLAEIESTGTALWKGLTQALQIELGITPVSGTFGDKTMAACPTVALNDTDEELGHPFVTIIQYGLYSKGYDPKGATGIYDEDTQAAIVRLQTDAGMQGAQISNSTTPTIFKALLGMEEFKMVSGGDKKIREIQQYLNHTYLSYIGLRACDGIYSRATNQALKYALQAAEQLPIGVANGNFGDTTKKCCPDIPYESKQYSYYGKAYTTEQMREFIRILQFALYVNGYTPYNVGESNEGVFDEVTQNALKEFKSFSALSNPEKAVATLDEWMSLFISTGNPERDGTAVDSAARMTKARIQAVIDKGYNTFGRYLTGTFDKGKGKNLLRSELSTLFQSYTPKGSKVPVKPKVFLIYQFGGDGENYFNEAQGYSDAEKAFGSLNALRVPKNHFVYFAVDYDFMESGVKSRVIPYFQGIKKYHDENNIQYKIGIYGSRNTCTLVRRAGLSESSFVSDMSTGYSGNMGFRLPEDWAFDQIKEFPLTADGQVFKVDKNIVSGRYTGFSAMTNESNDPFNLNGTGRIYINMSGQTIPVYRIRTIDGNGKERIIDEFDAITPEEFYIAWHPLASSGYQYDYVYFRDAHGNLNGGYIDPNGISGVQECFGNYTVVYDETASVPYKLVTRDSEKIPVGNDPNNYYVFTLTKPLDLLTSIGNIFEVLPAGTQVAFRDVMENLSHQIKSGVNMATAPVSYVKLPNDGWNSRKNCYLDLGIEKYGVTPEARVLR